MRNLVEIFCQDYGRFDVCRYDTSDYAYMVGAMKHWLGELSPATLKAFNKHPAAQGERPNELWGPLFKWLDRESPEGFELIITEGMIRFVPESSDDESSEVQR